MKTEQPTGRRILPLALAAVGVVYGDIGTSPLYAIKEIFGPFGVAPSPSNILGGLSLVFWSLVIVVSAKYVLFIMRADNKGEGGIMALMALAQRSVRQLPRLVPVVAILGIFGAALFYGDGVITPAISVLSAVEGLEVAAPSLSHLVVPLTLLIIVALSAWSMISMYPPRNGPSVRSFAPLWYGSTAVSSGWIIGQCRHSE